MTGFSKGRTDFKMIRFCRLLVLCFMGSQTQPKDKEKYLRGAKLPIFDDLLGGDSFLKKKVRVTQCKREQTLSAVDSFIK